MLFVFQLMGRNGRPRNDAARARAAARGAERGDRGTFDGHELRPLSERCIAYAYNGPPLQPPSYNDIHQFFQTPDHVVIFTEMIHEARVVPLDGRAHLPGAVPQWLGDSRGHWEGDTLVVDTTNFTDKASFNGGLIGKGASGARFHLVERFTRVDAETLNYEYTIEDPASFGSHWSAAIPMRKNDAPLYEYACHEGNYSLSNVLSGARYQERVEAEGSQD
mgnify:CR=1 FL=1